MLKTIGIWILRGILTAAVLWILKETSMWIKKRYQRSKNASHDYKKSYREYHGQLEVSCVEMEAPILLDDVYVAIQFLDEKSMSKYGTLENIEGAFREESKSDSGSSSGERQDGMRVANDEQYLMVLGGPGVGKSTFLRKVGLEALRGKEGNFAYECTPVFLELKKFTEDSIDIKVLITKEFEICGYPYPAEMTEMALKSGILLILLDGLDEVPDANVDNVVHKVQDFVNQYRQNRFIISSRRVVNIGASTQFANVEVADFDDSQIKRYIYNWFTSMSNGSTRRLDGEITTADLCWGTLNATEYQVTKELVRNPLLLTFLCLVYGKTHNFPRNRAALYEKALNIFLEKWQDEKHVSRDSSVSQYLNIWDEERLLSEIAAKNFEEDCLLFKKNELVDQIKEFGERNSITLSKVDAHKVLEAIAVEQGFFVERVSGVYSFPHLTFQEYLTANYFVKAQSIQRLVTDHLHDRRWREIFLFAVELMPEADSLLVEMESEASKSVNTDGLKALFQWAKRIKNPSDIQGNRIAKPTFAIRQFFALWILNKIHEIVKNIGNRYPHFNLDHSPHRYHNREQDQSRGGDRHGYTVSFDIYNRLHKCLDQERDQDLYLDLSIYRKLHADLYQHRHLDRDLIFYLNQALHGECSHDFYRGLAIYYPLHQNLHHDIYETLHPDYNQDFKIYIYVYLYFYQDLEPFWNQNFNLTLDLYQDLYRYIEINCYPLVSSKFYDHFEEELDRRITFIEYMEQAEIFREVDLQRLLCRFHEQRKFIKAARQSESVKPPEESIHDTWISVLGITDDMLAISPQEMQSYVQYLRAMKLIFNCQKVARHVTPRVWQEIEDQLLVTDFDEEGSQIGD